ncbi:MFS transporter [Pseudomonas sp. nanlin1]|uniref:MFS transporter n=1 Tax=Pseudomonas sp. nanlin1 TaxID=3040605 RepID=UPI00388EA939
MRNSAPLNTRSESIPRLPSALSAFLAMACGLIAANIYYAQPLAALISASAGLSAQATGLIVTLTQLGYGLGLLLIVPLGDLVESRKLASTVLAMGALALLMMSLAGCATMLLLCAFLVGLGSVTVQILVPYASHLAAPSHRGRVVGNVMAV